MAQTIQANELAAAVDEILTGYAQDVTEIVKDEAEDVAKDCISEIKTNARRLFRTKGSNSYANSWRKKVTERTPQGIVVTVYSRKYQIAHLLEHGHAVVRNGQMVGRAPAYPHIGPAEENASRELQRRVKIKIAGGAE